MIFLAEMVTRIRSLPGEAETFSLSSIRAPINFDDEVHRAWCAGRIRWYHRTIGEKDPPDTRETERQTRAVLQIMLKKQHERYWVFVFASSHWVDSGADACPAA